MDVDILILVALKDELDQLHEIDAHAVPNSKWTEIKHETAPFLHRDFLNKNNNKFTIAIARPTEMRGQAITTLGTTLIEQLNPKYIAMCGICAGRKDKTNMGDIIVGQSVFTYDMGKLVSWTDKDGNSYTELYKETKTYNSKDPILRKIQDLAKTSWHNDINCKRPISYQYQERWVRKILLDENLAPTITSNEDREKNCPDWTEILARLRKSKEIKQHELQLTKKGFTNAQLDKQNFPDGLPSDEDSKVIVGSIATGNNVVEDIDEKGRARIFKQLEDNQRNILAIDMEASAIGYLAHLNDIPWIVAKGVQDHADGEKNDRYRNFAAHASARFIIEFFHQYLEARSEKDHLPTLLDKGLPEKHNVPFQRPSSNELVSRDELLTSLTDNFITAHQDDFSQFGAIALSGIPGVGKSTVALEMAYRLGHRYPGGVFWVDARRTIRGAIESILKNIIKISILSEKSDEKGRENAQNQLDKEENIIATQFRNYIETNPCLIFLDALDSLDTASNCIKFLPKTGPSRVLITTRDTKIELRIRLENHELFELDIPSSIKVLTQFEKGVLKGSQEESVIEICKELGGLPLALDLASKFIKNRFVTYSDYFENLHQSKQKWRALSSKNLDKPSVESVFELCVEGVQSDEEHGHLSMRILCRFVLIHLLESEVNETTLKTLSSPEEFGPLSRKARINNIEEFNDKFLVSVELLERMGLIRINSETDYPLCHPLILAYMQEYIEEEDVFYVSFHIEKNWLKTKDFMTRYFIWINYENSISKYLNIIPIIQDISASATIVALEKLYDMADFCDAPVAEDIIDQAINISKNYGTMELRAEKAYVVFKKGRLDEAEIMYGEILEDLRTCPIFEMKFFEFLFNYGCLLLKLGGEERRKRACYLWNKPMENAIDETGLLAKENIAISYDHDEKNYIIDGDFIIYRSKLSLLRLLRAKMEYFPEEIREIDSDLEKSITRELKLILADNPNPMNFDNQYLQARGPVHIKMGVRLVWDC